MTIKDYYKFLFFSIFLAVILGISTFLTVLYGIPYGWDWTKYHAIAVQKYMSWDFSHLSIYPPLFHFLMIPAVYFFGSSIQYFQIIFSMITYSAVLYFFYRMEGLKAAALAGLGLLLSISFFQYSFSLTPEFLDLTLFPFTILFYLKNRYVTASSLLLVLFYSHYPAALFFIILFSYSLIYKRDFLKYLLVVGVLSIPTIIYMIPKISWMLYFLALPYQGMTILTETGYHFIFPLNNLMIYSGVFIWLMLPFTIYGMWRLKKFDMKQLLYVLWILAFIPLFFTDFYRWITFFIVPFSIFEGSVISKLIKEDVFNG